MFKGYKTYIVAGLGVIGAFAAYLTGDATLPVAGQAILTALLGAALRSGIANK